MKNTISKNNNKIEYFKNILENENIDLKRLSDDLMILFKDKNFKRLLDKYWLDKQEIIDKVTYLIWIIDLKLIWNNNFKENIDKEIKIKIDFILTLLNNAPNNLKIPKN